MPPYYLTRPPMPRTLPQPFRTVLGCPSATPQPPCAPLPYQSINPRPAKKIPGPKWEKLFESMILPGRCCLQNRSRFKVYQVYKSSLPQYEQSSLQLPLWQTLSWPCSPMAPSQNKITDLAPKWISILSSPLFPWASEAPRQRIAPSFRHTAGQELPWLGVEIPGGEPAFGRNLAISPLALSGHRDQTLTLQQVVHHGKDTFTSLTFFVAFLPFTHKTAQTTDFAS